VKLENEVAFKNLVKKSLKQTLSDEENLILESDLIQYKIALVEQLSIAQGYMHSRIQRHIAIVNAKRKRAEASEYSDKVRKEEAGLDKQGNLKNKTTFEDLLWELQEMNQTLNDIKDRLK